MAKGPSDGDFVFETNEQILAFHGPQIYEAKVVRREMRMNPEGDRVPMYLSHYSGWNKSWDEWLQDDRVMKHNEKNLKRQVELQEQHKKREKKRPQRPAAEVGGSTRILPRREQEDQSSKRRRGDRGASNAADTDPPDAGAAYFVVPLPETLKLKLLDDWNFVTRSQKLLELPRKTTISLILDSYCKHVEPQGPAAQALALEVTSGLKAYFEAACGTMLLYRQERLQYTDQKEASPDTDICDVYGAEHLLRLFVKLPTLLAHANVDERGSAHLAHCLQDILRFMAVREEKLFPIDAYIGHSAEYQKRNA